MKKLEDKLAASIKPERGKTPADVTPTAAGQSPRKTPAGPRPKAAEGQAPTGAKPKPADGPSRANSPAVKAAGQKGPATAQRGGEAAPSRAPDLNDPKRPLHPKRIWPD